MSERILKIVLILLALIGLAILVIPFTAEAQTHIYRSIQNNTGAIWTSGGTITLTVNDTIATFSSDAPDSIGRGCAIEYDSTGSSSVKAICFIKYRTDKRTFGVQRFQGGQPAQRVAGTTTWNILHSYTTYENFHNGTENTGINATVRAFDAHTDGINIDARSEYWHVAFYAGAHDISTTQGGDDMDTSPTEMLELYAPCGRYYVGVSQRHTGKLTYRGAVLTGGAANGWITNDDAGNRVCQDVIFNGLQWDNTGTGARDALTINSSQAGLVQNYLIKDCIFHGSDSVATSTTSHYAINWQTGTSSNGGKVKVINSLFYGWKTAASTTNEGALLFTSVNIADSLLVEGCTIYACQDGIKRSNAGNVLIIRNTITNRCNDGFNGGIAGSFNVSDIVGDCGACTSMITGTVAFTSQSTGDFSLHSSDTVALNAGTTAAAGSLLAPTTDIRNYTRTGTMDVGAFSFGEAASGCSVEVTPASTSPVLFRRRVPPQ